MPAPVAPQPLTRSAVTYLRVSTREQAAGGGGDEGFSIPAQRAANTRKAAELDAAIVAEFVDAGESAKSANRPELQRLLAYIAEHRVDYCIVHKVDRLARNRVDDAVIHLSLRQAGVTLVSATENIDETPSGMLTHGIMSTIAEFYSLNLAAEVTKGLVQKARQGGTPTKAPIGYLNVRARDAQGREVRTVQIDPQRAPLIQWAFNEYARGQTAVIDLQKALTARGLTSVPSPQRGGRPLGKATLYKVLTNPYYIGIVRWNGAEYQGSHEPLVDTETWDRVQSLLKARGNDSSRHVKHDHYLKGVLYCGVCRSRMILDFPTHRHGTTYAYFICRGRASKRTPCARKAVRVHVAEALVEQVYASVRITDDTYRRLAEQIDRAYDERAASRATELADLAAHRAQLDAESDKLLRAHFADAIDLPTLKRHQDRIRTSLADIDRRLAEGRDAYTAERSHMRMALELLRDCHRAYKDSTPDLRRIANAAFFERIYLTEEGEPTPVPTATFTDFIDTGRGSNKNTRVEPRGIEPLTSCLQSRRSTN